MRKVLDSHIKDWLRAVTAQCGRRTNFYMTPSHCTIVAVTIGSESQPAIVSTGQTISNTNAI